MRAIPCLAMIVVGTVLVGATVQADEEKVALDKVPKAVLKAVQKRFPKLKMTGASKEKEGDKLMYEVSLKKEGKNIDVTVTEGGAITLIEAEVAFKDLPKPVAKTYKEKYPNATYKIVESVTKVQGGKETLEYYEAHLVAADKKKWEVEVLADGKFKSATEIKGK